MSLSKEDKEKLVEQVLDDLPQDFAFFSPWVSLFLIQLFSSIVAGAVMASIIVSLLDLSSPQLFGGFVFLVLPMVLVPNTIIMQGGMTLGIQCVRFVLGAFVLIAFGCMVAVLNAAGGVFLGAFVALTTSLLAFIITFTIRFQVFAFHRKRMVQWSKERLEKNRVYRSEKQSMNGQKSKR